jgi:hypothetical protein
MDHTGLSETLGRLEDRLDLLGDYPNLRTLGVRALSRKVVSFIDVLTSLDSNIEDVYNRVKHERPGYTLYVYLIHRAVSNAKDSVHGLDVRNDGDWGKVEDTVKKLHDAMSLLMVGATLLDAKFVSICRCIVNGTKIGDDFIYTPSDDRNSKMLDILEAIGSSLFRIATNPVGVYDEKYYNILGDTAVLKMKDIIHVLKWKRFSK